MKKITSKYLIVLAILSLVILGSQMLMQQTIKNSKSDSRIINISGRQRMLSQKLTKSALKMQNAKTERVFEDGRVELKAALALWSQSHQDLQSGSTEIDVSEMNGSRVIKQLFADIDPSFNQIKAAATRLAESNLQQAQQRHLDIWVDQILKYESNFLTLMNKITFEYDRLASAKVEKLSGTEYFLLGFTFLLILLEAFFIFKPMLTDSRKKEQAIEDLNLLREDERSFSASQIKQANQKIKRLRELALQLKEELSEKDKWVTIKTSDHMTQNLLLQGQLDESKSVIDKLKKEIATLRKNPFSPPPIGIGQI